MEFVHEVTAYLENKPGRLAKICSALAQEKVDIQALSVMETDGPSVLRFVTTDLETTKSVLTSLGTEYRITEVLAVQMENRTGSLAKVLERLAEEHINVEYAYVSTMAAPGKALGIFHTSNPKRAAQILSDPANSAAAGGPLGGSPAVALALSAMRPTGCGASRIEARASTRRTGGQGGPPSIRRGLGQAPPGRPARSSGSEAPLPSRSPPSSHPARIRLPGARTAWYNFRKIFRNF